MHGKKKNPEEQGTEKKKQASLSSSWGTRRKRSPKQSMQDVFWTRQ